MEERIGEASEASKKRKLQNEYTSIVKEEAHVEQITQQEFEVASELIDELLPMILDLMDQGIGYKSFLSEMKTRKFEKKAATTTALTKEEEEKHELVTVFKQVRVKNREEKRRIVQAYLEKVIEPAWGLIERHHLKPKKDKEGLIFNKAIQKWVKKEDYERAIKLSKLDRMDEQIRTIHRQRLKKYEKTMGTFSPRKRWEKKDKSKRHLGPKQRMSSMNVINETERFMKQVNVDKFIHREHMK